MKNYTLNLLTSNGGELYSFLGSDIKKLRENRTRLREVLRNYPQSGTITARIALDLSKEPTITQKPSKIVGCAIDKYRKHCILIGNGFKATSYDCGGSGDYWDYDEYHQLPKFSVSTQRNLSLDDFSKDFNGEFVRARISNKSTLRIQLSDTVNSQLERLLEIDETDVNKVLERALSFLNLLRFDFYHEYETHYRKEGTEKYISMRVCN